MQGIHTHIPETNHVPREYIVAAILSLLFMVPLFLVPALALIIIIIIMTFMQGVHNYIRETHHIRRVYYSIFTICAACNVISHVKYAMYI